MTYNQAKNLLDSIEFRDWEFHLDFVDSSRGPALWMQVRFMAQDVEDGEFKLQHGRKWLISTHMTPSEIVSTALKAVLAAVEHEAREDFTYAGRRIFGPHIDINALWSVAELTDSRRTQIIDRGVST